MQIDKVMFWLKWQKKKNTFLKTALGEDATLTFQSFALEGLGHNTGGFALDLLGLPESFAQLLYIVTIDYICVPSTKTKQVINRASCVRKNVNHKKAAGALIELNKEHGKQNIWTQHHDFKSSQYRFSVSDNVVFKALLH